MNKITDDFDEFVEEISLNESLKKDIISNVIKEAQVQLDETIMVGDTVLDAEGAELLGIDFIAVTYGFGFKTKEELENSQKLFIINSLSDIDNIPELKYQVKLQYRKVK